MFRDLTNESDVDLGNFTVPDKFNCRDYRVNMKFPAVSNDIVHQRHRMVLHLK